MKFFYMGGKCDWQQLMRFGGDPGLMWIQEILTWIFTIARYGQLCAYSWLLKKLSTNCYEIFFGGWDNNTTWFWSWSRSQSRSRKFV